MSTQAPDIKLAAAGDTWVLADEKGPVDLTGAVVTRTVLGPRPSAAIVIADVACQGGKLGKVTYAAVAGERIAGWLGYRFRAQWGPAADQVRFFPDTGPHWVLVG